MKQLLKSTRFWKDNYLILRELKYFPRIITLAMVFALGVAALEGVTVGFIASFLQGLTNPDTPPIQTGIHWFNVWFLATEASPSERVCRLAILILVLAWSRSGFDYLSRMYSRSSEFHLADNIRKRLFEQLQSLSLSYYSETRSGELINTVTAQVNQATQAFRLFSNLITRCLTILAYVISMFMLSWQLSIAAVTMFSLLSASLSSLVAWVREASFTVPKADGKLTSVAMELINGIRTVQASATQDFERKRFYQATDAVKTSNIKLASIAELVTPLTQGLSTTILITIVTVTYLTLVISGGLQASSILTFIFVLFRMMPLISQANGMRSKLRGLQGALHNINDLLKTDNKIYLENGNISFSSLRSSIVFESVDFGYFSDEIVLSNISLSIKRGQTVALVGSSGAGKTTLADLIPRFYDPIRGKILIDGIDLRDLEINSLRRKIGIVSQNTFIFNTSIRNNIAYGVDKADEKSVRQAAEQANASEFIDDLPEGFDTLLGDQGVRLSGGQRQRIAIARALLRNPEILILDEATSALDSVTERLIQDSLERLSQGRTIIAIAHRLSTIVRADWVVVLDQGRIIEQGTYQELLKQRGVLWKFHEMQFNSDQDNPDNLNGDTDKNLPDASGMSYR